MSNAKKPEQAKSKTEKPLSPAEKNVRAQKQLARAKKEQAKRQKEVAKARKEAKKEKKEYRPPRLKKSDHKKVRAGSSYTVRAEHGRYKYEGNLYEPGEEFEVVATSAIKSHVEKGILFVSKHGDIS